MKAASNTPANAASKPLTAKTPSLIFPTFTPARKARRGVAPDGKNAISDRSFENHHVKHEEDDKRPKDRGVDACKIAATNSAIDKLLPDGLSRDKRKASRYSIGDTLKKEERPQSHEEGRNADQCDKNAIQRADEDPADERAEECQSTADERSQPEKHQSPHSTDRTNRYVDFGCRDDERLPECHHRQHGRDLGQRLQVAG